MAKMLVYVFADAAQAKAAFKETGISAERMAGVVDSAGAAMKDAMLGVAKAFLPMAAAFETGKFLKGAIDNAENYKKAQDSLAVAIQHTGGNLSKLGPQYAATAKAAAQYGVNQIDATTALARATLLTGHAKNAQRAYQEALVLSKATGKDFNAVLTATSKAQEGSTGSLSRYGIILPKVTTAQDALKAANKNATAAQQAHAKAIDTATAATEANVQIMKRFGAQAAANTNASDKLRANFSNLETEIGTKLLPVFNKIVEGIQYVVTWLSSPQVASAIGQFKDSFIQSLQPIIQWVETNWPQIKQTIITIMSDTWAVVKTVIALFKAGWAEFGGTIKTVVRNDFATIKGIIENVVKVIRGVVEIVRGIAHGDWSQVWAGIKNVVSGTFGAIWDYITGIGRNFAAGMAKMGSMMLNAFIGALKAGAHLLASVFDLVFIAPINALISAIDAIKLPAIGFSIFGHHVGFGGWGGFKIPTIPSLDAGGEVLSTGLAMVHRGETFSGVGKSLAANVVFQPGAVVVHGSADAAFAKTLAGELATQLRGGRVPAFQQAIAAIG